jgi:nitrate/nitrite-specific signal transduction histidine kinase
MRERADILQGTLALMRPPEGGTLVILEMPVAQAAAV